MRWQSNNILNDLRLWLKVIAVTKQICLTPSVCLTASWCLHRSTSKSTKPFNACICTKNSEVPALLRVTPSHNQTALHWRRRRTPDSAEQRSDDGAERRRLLSSASCHMSLVPFAWERTTLTSANGSRGREEETPSHPHPFKSPPEIKEPPVTSLKAVLDQGWISTLHFLSGMKQDDCYCGTLLQLFIAWLQSSHFYLKKKRYTSTGTLQPGVNKHVFHPLWCRFEVEVSCINGTWSFSRASR